MKKIVVFISFAVLAAIVLTGCGTTSQVTETQKDQTSVAKAPEKETVKDTPEVAFAKKLQAKLKENDVKGAIALFDNMPGKLQGDVELKLLLASLYISDSQLDNAVMVADEILEDNPENIDAWEIKSLVAREKGDKKSYKAVTAKILEKDPYNATVNIQVAQDYVLNKKYNLARNTYKKALKSEPQNSDALFGYAQTSYYTNDVKTAKKTFQEILEKEPDNSLALAYMGKIVAEDGNYVQATKYVQQAIKYDPYSYDYYMDLGSYLRYQGKFDDAAKAWYKAVEIDPTYFLAYAHLAGNYDDQGKYDLALQNYHKVIETNPKYFYAYEETAILEYHMGNYKSAITYFQKAYEYSDNYSYSLMIAACYYKLKDSFNAKKILEAQLKKLTKDTLEYDMVRFYKETYSKNAEASLSQKINKADNSTTRGKMLFYMGLYCELNNADAGAQEYYGKVHDMSAPMFFEYRIAEWSLGL